VPKKKQTPNEESFEVSVSLERDKHTGEMRNRIRRNEPRGVEKDIMDWANDPFSSANTEDPVDSLEEEIRNLPHFTAVVRTEDLDGPNGRRVVGCVTEEDVMRAIRHYRAKIWESSHLGD
jgi:hypothetical protein